MGQGFTLMFVLLHPDFGHPLRAIAVADEDYRPP